MIIRCARGRVWSDKMNFGYIQERGGVRGVGGWLLGDIMHWGLGRRQTFSTIFFVMRHLREGRTNFTIDT
jgi:hypothetical protein